MRLAGIGRAKNDRHCGRGPQCRRMKRGGGRSGCGAGPGASSSRPSRSRRARGRAAAGPRARVGRAAARAAERRRGARRLLRRALARARPPRPRACGPPPAVKPTPPAGRGWPHHLREPRGLGGGVPNLPESTAPKRSSLNSFTVMHAARTTQLSPPSLPSPLFVKSTLSAVAHRSPPAYISTCWV